MFPLLSIAIPFPWLLGFTSLAEPPMYVENSMPDPSDLILVIKKSDPPLLSDWNGFSVGKSSEFVNPPTIIESLTSTTTLSAISSPVPPKKVKNLISWPSGDNLTTNASIPPAFNCWISDSVCNESFYARYRSQILQNRSKNWHLLTDLDSIYI